MPRVSKVDACMFCGDTPCSCNGPAKKKAPTRKKVASSTFAKSDSVESPPAVTSSQDASSVPTTAVSIDVRAAMKAAVTEPKPLPEKPGRLITREQADADHSQSYDPEFIAALNVLEPILHPNEKRIYRDILDRPASRAARWKARNASVQS